MKKEKKNYSIWNNYRWGTRLYEEGLGKKYHFQDGIFILLSVLSPFVGMAFPSVAIRILQSGMSIEIIFSLILFYVIAMKLISIGHGYTTNNYQMNYALGRINGMKPLENHLLNMNYEKMESKEAQQRLEAASKCIFRGNDYGIECFLRQFPMFTFSIIGFLIYSCLIFKISPWVFIYMMVTAVILSILSLRQGKYEEKSEEYICGLYDKRKKAFEESFDNSSRNDMILYQAKEWILSKLYSIIDGFLKFYKRFYRIQLTCSVSTAILNFIRDAVVYLILIMSIAKGNTTVSELLLYTGAIAGYSAWINGILEAVQIMVIQNHTITDYRNFLNFGNNEDLKPTKEFLKIKGATHEIKLENVSFCYEENPEETISNINLIIHPGERVALVGANGAGKTTLVKLITGLYKPTKGKIYLDGIDITDIPCEDYYKEFAAVFQESKIFSCSIAQNVSCSIESDNDAVKESLRKAGLINKVDSFKEGINTILTKNISPDGIEFSGGETQKLMLARAIYRNAPVLILDEPTAALDPIAESRMYESYNEFGKDKTSIFISHRLSSTRFCDRVCFLKDGKIVEVGNHEELLNKQGYYSEMYNIQAQYYKEDFTNPREEVAYD